MTCTEWTSGGSCHPPLCGPGLCIWEMLFRTPYLANTVLIWVKCKPIYVYSCFSGVRHMRAIQSCCTAAVTLVFVMCKGLDLGKNLKAWSHLITYCISLSFQCSFSILQLTRCLLVASSFHFSFEQLKMAITHLKRQANKKSEGSLAYVISSFLAWITASAS